MIPQRQQQQAIRYKIRLNLWRIRNNSVRVRFMHIKTERATVLIQPKYNPTIDALSMLRSNFFYIVRCNLIFILLIFIYQIIQ